MHCCRSDSKLEAAEKTSEKPKARSVGINQLGGRYESGRPLPLSVRYQIVELMQNGLRTCDISKQLKITHGCVSRILARFYKNGTVMPFTVRRCKPRVTTPQINFVLLLKRQHPNIFAWEIRENLLQNGICQRYNVPSISTISRIIRNSKEETNSSSDSSQMSSFHFLIINPDLKTRIAASKLEATDIIGTYCDSTVTPSSSSIVPAALPAEVPSIEEHHWSDRSDIEML
ncbi:unnamed protein product [Thelazia callipaeda]|uniref:Paired domain-containing protein n=1 Tax=Thelazia callipaeda TaxID=103827 RepID=A0A0N5CSS4_THECL|nr:unnamed protein product [Thelazia callipaeda]